MNGTRQFRFPPPGLASASPADARVSGAVKAAEQTVPAASVVLLPGWRNCSPAHWLSQWERLHGYQRLVQKNWDTPIRGDWLQCLDDYVHGSTMVPLVLVGYELGANLLAEWGARSGHAHKIAAAFLVAPLDLERSPLQMFKTNGWWPITHRRLPFPSLLVASNNDPLAPLVRVRGMAFNLGAKLHNAGDVGHMDVTALLGDWELGHHLLLSFLQEAHVRIFPSTRSGGAAPMRPSGA